MRVGCLAVSEPELSGHLDEVLPSIADGSAKLAAVGGLGAARRTAIIVFHDGRLASGSSSPVTSHHDEQATSEGS